MSVCLSVKKIAKVRVNGKSGEFCFLAPVSSEFPIEECEIIMAPQECSDISGRPSAHPGGRGRSSPVVALKSGNKEVVALESDSKAVVALESDSKEVVALKSGFKEEDLGHQVIQRFPQEKRRNTFEVEEEEQKGKWRRKERSKKSEEGVLDSFEMEEVGNMVEVGNMEEKMEELGKMDKKQMMDDVALLMKKVAEALAEFAMDQSVDNLGRMGLEE